MFWKMYQDDNAYGDITSELVIPGNMEVEAQVIAKEQCILAGVGYLKENIQKLGLRVECMEDGEFVEVGTVVMRVWGNAREILKVERTLLNILGRMSGIATETRKIVEKVKKVNPKVRIAATRKTLWGYLDKMAVVIGGGDSHRWNLGDMVMIKDNHIALVGLEEAIRRAEKVSFTKKIEVEVESEKDALKAAEMGVDIILLDNMNPEEVCKIAEELRGYDVLIEVSGGITPENIGNYAKCNIDIISLGYITHSVSSINFSMEIMGMNEDRK